MEDCQMGQTNENQKVETPATPERKITAQYVVTRYENGSASVENLGAEGIPELPAQELFADVESLAKLIAEERISRVAAALARESILRDIAQSEEQANTPVEPQE